MNVEDLNVVIMAYARADHFTEVLRACEKELLRVKVFLDFPASDTVAEQQAEILKIIESSPLEIDLRRRKKNYGLVKSILTTVEDELLLNDHIVLLEDDCVPQEGFFQFMGDSLTNFKDDPKVSTVCGTRTRCRFNPWGWATWLDEQLREYLTNHTVDRMIWSLTWLATQYQDDTLSCYPQKTLIENIGLDNTGVHSHEEGYTQWLYSQIVEDLKE